MEVPSCPPGIHRVTGPEALGRQARGDFHTDGNTDGPESPRKSQGLRTPLPHRPLCRRKGDTRGFHSILFIRGFFCLWHCVKLTLVVRLQKARRGASKNRFVLQRLLTGSLWAGMPAQSHGLSSVGLPTQLGAPTVRAPAHPGCPRWTTQLLTYPDAQHGLAINAASLDPSGFQWTDVGWPLKTFQITMTQTYVRLPQLSPCLSLCPRDWGVWGSRSVCGLWWVENLHNFW